MTDKPVQYAAKTHRYARFGAPQTYLAQLRRAGLDHHSLARTFALSYERLAIRNRRRPGQQRPLCPRRARLLVKQEAKRC